MKVFMTGATGYVGGDALHVLLTTHPSWHFTLLARDPTRLGILPSTHPTIRVVEGDLSNLELLEREAAAATTVLHFASADDAPAVRALLAGLGSSPDPRFLIHTSGTANLLADDFATGNVGVKSPRIVDDLADIAEITCWPPSVPHRPVDALVLGASDSYKNISSAIVCPPAILGKGRGPGGKRTLQVPLLIELIRRRGRGFQIGAGEAVWSFVHVSDTSSLFLLLAEAAAAGGGKADWGAEAYYFVEGGEMEWGAVSRVVAKALHAAGAIASDEVDVVGREEAEKMHPLIVGSSGMNARSRASRARRVLGWEAGVRGFEEGVQECVREELGAGTSRVVEMEMGHMPAPVKD